MPNFGNIIAQSSFSSATGTLATTPTRYAATVGSSYSKALPASGSTPDGTIIVIRIVSLTGTSLLTITRDGSDVIRHCGASLTSMVLARDGAELWLYKRGSGWDVGYVKGRQQQFVWVSTPGAGAAGQGTDRTKIRRYGVVVENVGSAITYAETSANGSDFTTTEWGRYAMLRADGVTGSAASVAISLNSTEYDTSSASIAESTRLVLSTAVSGNLGNVSAAAYLPVGAIVRAHDGATVCNFTANGALFRMMKLDE